MKAQGQLDDDEIIRMKQIKDMELRQRLKNETFEQKYEREIKVLLDKQRKREQEKLQREQEECTFAPRISKKSKSPIKNEKSDDSIEAKVVKSSSYMTSS